MQLHTQYLVFLARRKQLRCAASPCRGVTAFPQHLWPPATTAQHLPGALPQPALAAGPPHSSRSAIVCGQAATLGGSAHGPRQQSHSQPGVESTAFQGVAEEAAAALMRGDPTLHQPSVALDAFAALWLCGLPSSFPSAVVFPGIRSFGALGAQLSVWIASVFGNWSNREHALWTRTRVERICCQLGIELRAFALSSKPHREQRSHLDFESSVFALDSVSS